MRGTVVERIVSEGRSYEVRRTGSALTLTTEGVLHTLYDESAVISGRVWDLLALPPIAIGASRILVLGVGGGAAIRQLLRFGSPTSIVGVDLDGVHLDLARRHFGLDDGRVSLVHGDARAFVADDDATYDCIIEDVFVETDGDPRRALLFDATWAGALESRLSKNGVLVVNHASRQETREGVLDAPAFRKRFRSVLTLETSTACNQVVALFRDPIDPRTLRAHARRSLGDAADRLDAAIRSRR